MKQQNWVQKVLWNYLQMSNYALVECALAGFYQATMINKNC